MNAQIQVFTVVALGFQAVSLLTSVCGQEQDGECVCAARTLCQLSWDENLNWELWGRGLGQAHWLLCSPLP